MARPMDIILLSSSGIQTDDDVTRSVQDWWRNWYTCRTLAMLAVRTVSHAKWQLVRYMRCLNALIVSWV